MRAFLTALAECVLILMRDKYKYADDNSKPALALRELEHQYNINLLTPELKPAPGGYKLG